MKKTDIILGCFVLIPILCLIIPVPLVLIGCVIYRKHWNFDVGAF